MSDMSTGRLLGQEARVSRTSPLPEAFLLKLASAPTTLVAPEPLPPDVRLWCETLSLSKTTLWNAQGAAPAVGQSMLAILRKSKSRSATAIEERLLELSATAGTLMSTHHPARTPTTFATVPFALPFETLAWQSS